MFRKLMAHATRPVLGLFLFTTVLPLHSQELTVAQTTRIRWPSIRPDFEFDPTPYFEHGYSGHVGIEWNHWRAEGEILRTDVPEWVQGNKGFEVTYRGGGVKVQYFLSRKQKGTFLGVRTEITRESVRLQHTTLEANPTRHDFGVDAGYRFCLTRHLYFTPWGGMDYTLDAHDFQLGEKTYRDNRFGLFAAVHFGIRF